MGGVGRWLGQKLYSFKQENGTAFPPPPRAPYWIELRLDWADFAPVQPNDSNNQSTQRFPMTVPRGDFMKVHLGSALCLSLVCACLFMGRQRPTIEYPDRLHPGS